MNTRHPIVGLMAFLLFQPIASAQELDSLQRDTVDTRYLEDQFYIGLGYNGLRNKPELFGQRNLSYSLQLGLIKDLPLNKARNFGLGIGLGYAVNSYYSNMVATQTPQGTSYSLVEQSDFKRSKLETHALEFPLELRWRTSNAVEYRFWRIYGGAKLSYVFSGRSRMVMEGDRQGFSNGDIDPLQYGLMLSVGYHTWNLHFYYGLNPLLKDGVQLDSGEPVDLKVLRIGVIFYIL